MSNIIKLYTLPCLFTSANFFCGFLAILFTFAENYNQAAWLIIMALAFDIMDGRVARLTKHVSEFGAELDSLADAVSFGLAPGILFYFSMIEQTSLWSMLVVYFYALCGLLRLARYNIGNSSENFEGLPIPGAAFFIVSIVIYGINYPFAISRVPHCFFPIIMVILALLMVSNLKYPGFKAKKAKEDIQKRYKKLILTLILLSATIIEPAICFMLISLLYIISGIFITMVNTLKKFIGSLVKHDKEILENK